MAAARPRAVDGQPDADVLVGAEDAGHRSALLVAAVVAVAAVAGAAAVDRSSEAVPALALRAGELVPRDRTVDGRLAEAGMHVEVVNTADVAMDVRAAALVPGAWEVDVVDRPLVQPGESLVLSLHRTVVCDGRASYGPFPEHLEVEARTGGEAVLVRLPVAAAYGGRLDDALRDPGRACVVTGGGPGGPIGDLVASWPARRAGGGG